MVAADTVRLPLTDARIPGSSLCLAISMAQFLDAWLACDHEHLDQSLIRFVGHHAYNINRLREDLGRFAVLLGAEPDPSSQPAQQPCPDPVDVPF
jgi:hypothetical protein